MSVCPEIFHQIFQSLTILWSSWGRHPDRQYRYNSISSGQLSPPIHVRYHLLLRFPQPECLYQSRKLPSPLSSSPIRAFSFIYSCFKLLTPEYLTLFSFSLLLGKQQMDGHGLLPRRASWLSFSLSRVLHSCIDLGQCCGISRARWAG